MIKEITSAKEKKDICRDILKALPDWFEIPEAVERFIENSVDRIFFADFDGDRPTGFIYLEKTGNATVELAVMGVLKEYHRKGIGRALFQAAKAAATEAGFSVMQVKTVKMGMYPDYDITNRFYLSLGFKELEVIPQIWGPDNSCQIYVMALK